MPKRAPTAVYHDPELVAFKPETAEGREAKMIALTMDLVEQRLIDGTASAAETVHFLKLGQATADIQKRKNEAECALMEAKAEAIRSQTGNAELLNKAIAAFTDYKGASSDDDGFDDDYGDFYEY